MTLNEKLLCVQWISKEEQEKLDQQVKDFEAQLQQKKLDASHLNEQEIQKIKAEIETLRESRLKMRSHTSSVGSSVTIYPPTTPSPDTDVEAKAAEEGGERDELEEGTAEDGKEATEEDGSAVEAQPTQTENIETKS